MAYTASVPSSNSTNPGCSYGYRLTQVDRLRRLPEPGVHP